MTDGKIADSNSDWLGRRDWAWRNNGYRGPSRREFRREQALADWLGPERVPAVFADLRPPAQSLSGLVEELMLKIPQQEIFWLERLREAWPELLGEMNAQQSRPLSLRNGNLVIEVSNPTWRFVLERQKKIEIKAILQTFLQRELRSVRFVPPGRFSP